MWLFESRSTASRFAPDDSRSRCRIARDVVLIQVVRERELRREAELSDRLGRIPPGLMAGHERHEREGVRRGGRERPGHPLVESGEPRRDRDDADSLASHLCGDGVGDLPPGQPLGGRPPRRAGSRSRRGVPRRPASRPRPAWRSSGCRGRPRRGRGRRPTSRPGSRSGPARALPRPYSRLVVAWADRSAACLNPPITRNTSMNAGLRMTTHCMGEAGAVPRSAACRSVPAPDVRPCRAGPTTGRTGGRRPPRTGR